MLEIFEYDFLVRALLVGTFCAVVTAVVGNFLVASRQAVVSDMLAHTSLAGVGLGIFLNISPSFVGILVSIGASIFLFLLGSQKKIPQEAISVLLLTGGMALALLLAHLSKNNPVSFETFLFGSLLTITNSEAVLFAVLGLGILVCIFLFWNRFLCLIFDIDFFRSRFRFSIFFEIFFLMMVAVLVALSLQIIGGLLVGALLVIPVITAQNMAKSFRASVWWSVFLNVMGVLGGIFFSFYADIPTSSAIVLSLWCLFLVFGVLVPFGKKFLKRELYS